MMKMLPLVLLAACAEGPEPETAAPVTTPITYAAETGTIATGGYQLVTISDQAQASLSGSATDGFAVEPASGVWPNLVAPDYHVRALTAGNGTFTISTTHGVASGSVSSAEVDHVALEAGKVVLFAADGTHLIDDSMRIDGTTVSGDSFATVTLTF